jgi:hypothetical protein
MLTTTIRLRWRDSELALSGMDDVVSVSCCSCCVVCGMQESLSGLQGALAEKEVRQDMFTC